MGDFEATVRELRATWGNELNELDDPTFARDRARQLILTTDRLVVALLTWQHNAEEPPDHYTRPLDADVVYELAQNPPGRWLNPKLVTVGGGVIQAPASALLSGWRLPTQGGPAHTDIAYIIETNEE